jgi:hypothetical protein
MRYSFSKVSLLFVIVAGAYIEKLLMVKVLIIFFLINAQIFPDIESKVPYILKKAYYRCVISPTLFVNEERNRQNENENFEDNINNIPLDNTIISIHLHM